MPAWLNTLFDLAAQFTGGRPASGPHIVWFGIAAVGWGILALAAHAKQRRRPSSREHWLLFAFTFGFCRELLMIAIKVLQAFDLVSATTLHMVFPPAEHALQNMAMVFIAAAFMRFVSDVAKTAETFIKVGSVVVGICYLVTFWWWANHIHANPESKFGHTWCDLLFHTAMSSLLLFPIAYIWTRSSGWLRNVVCGALFCFLQFELWKIPDILTGEVYSPILAPIRHGLYLAAIPMLGYVYLKELAEEAGRAYSLMEEQVEQRTHELQQAQEQLVRNEKLAVLGQLAGGVAHEIRNPMGVIKNAAYFLDATRSEGDEDTKDAVEEIGRGLASAERIIGELLDYARGPVPSLSRFPLVKAFDTALEIVKLPSSVIVERPTPSNVIVEADHEQVERLLANLIQNASQAMPEGGRITLRCSSQNGNAIAEVSDTGIGIPSDEMEQIFEPLFTKRARGIGLGLPLCRRYAEQNGGELTVQSEVGVGSTFTLTLPLASQDGATR